jgi:hypothetical protein
VIPRRTPTSTLAYHLTQFVSQCDALGQVGLSLLPLRMLRQATAVTAVKCHGGEVVPDSRRDWLACRMERSSREPPRSLRGGALRGGAVVGFGRTCGATCGRVPGRVGTIRGGGRPPSTRSRRLMLFRSRHGGLPFPS